MRNSPNRTVKALAALWVLFQLADMAATIELFVLWPGQASELGPAAWLVGWPLAAGLKIAFTIMVAVIFLNLGEAWEDILLMRLTCIVAVIPPLATGLTVLSLVLGLPVSGLSVPGWWPFVTV